MVFYITADDELTRWMWLKPNLLPRKVVTFDYLNYNYFESCHQDDSET